MTNHIMVDLETLGTGNEAAIIAIGAVRFDPNGHSLGDGFYCRVSASSSLALGLKADGGALDFWLAPEQDAARKRLYEDTPIDLPSALEGFDMWANEEPFVAVWGNGATFDNVILTSAYRLVGLRCPWEFRQDRCFRTFKNLKPEISYEFVGEKHYALDDARSQALHVQKVRDALAIVL